MLSGFGAAGFGAAGFGKKGGGKKGGKGKKAAAPIQEDIDVPNTLCVASLPRDVTEEEMKDLFFGFGTVTGVQKNHNLKNSCLVTFAEASDADSVLAKEEFEFEGKWIFIRLATTSEVELKTPKPDAWDTGKGKSSWPFAGKGLKRKRDQIEVSERVMFNGLPEWAKDGHVCDWFLQYGHAALDVKLELDPWGEHHNAIVTFADVATAQAVLDMQVQDGKKLEFHGNPVTLEPLDRLMEAKITNKLFIIGVPEDATEEHVENVFKQFGNVDEVHFKRDEHGSFHGNAFVTFSKSDDCKRCVESKESRSFYGVRLKVTYAIKNLAAYKPKPTEEDREAMIADAKPPTTNILWLFNMPSDPKCRDVFKFFYSYGMTRIRENLGGNKALVQFSSVAECERAFFGKLGMQMHGVRVELREASQMEYDEEARMQDNAREQKQIQRDQERGYPMKRGDSVGKGKEKGKRGALTADGKELHRIRPNDWLCPNCQELVYAKKESCRKCGTPKALGTRMDDLDVEIIKKIKPALDGTVPPHLVPKLMDGTLRVDEYVANQQAQAQGKGGHEMQPIMAWK